MPDDFNVGQVRSGTWVGPVRRSCTSQRDYTSLSVIEEGASSTAPSTCPATTKGPERCHSIQAATARHEMTQYPAGPTSSPCPVQPRLPAPRPGSESGPGLSPVPRRPPPRRRLSQQPRPVPTYPCSPFCSIHSLSLSASSRARPATRASDRCDPRPPAPPPPRTPSIQILLAIRPKTAALALSTHPPPSCPPSLSHDAPSVPGQVALTVLLLRSFGSCFPSRSLGSSLPGRQPPAPHTPFVYSCSSKQ